MKDYLSLIEEALDRYSAAFDLPELFRKSMRYSLLSGGKRIRACLADEGLELRDLNGVLVTHEHSDHVAGLAMLSKYSDLPMYMSGGTARAILRQISCRKESLRMIEAGVPLSL